MDMLPLGYVTTPGSTSGPDHTCHLSRDEQYTQLTLWAMVRSPLFFGGDMRFGRLDAFTLSLLTNAEVLRIVDGSSGNAQVVQSNTTRVWRALGDDGATVYAALFNVGGAPARVSASLEVLRVPGASASTSCRVRDVWAGTSNGTATDDVSAQVSSHGVALLALNLLITNALIAFFDSNG